MGMDMAIYRKQQEIFFSSSLTEGLNKFIQNYSANQQIFFETKKQERTPQVSWI